MKRTAILCGAVALLFAAGAAKAATYSVWPGWTVDTSTLATYPNMQFQFKTYTVATLPTCNSGAKGAMAFVTDAAATPVYNATAANGGTVAIPVMCDGTNWKNR